MCCLFFFNFSTNLSWFISNCRLNIIEILLYFSMITLFDLIFEFWNVLFFFFLYYFSSYCDIFFLFDFIFNHWQNTTMIALFFLFFSLICFICHCHSFNLSTKTNSQWKVTIQYLLIFIYLSCYYTVYTFVVILVIYFQF